MYSHCEDCAKEKEDFPKAIAVFRELSRSKDPSIRAGALLRLGRNLRKTQQTQAALDVYDELEQMGPMPIGGLPADLLARHARCVLLDQLKRTTEFKQEAGTLYAGLHDGRWQLARGAYCFYVQQVRRWYTPDAGFQAHEQDALATTAAVELLSEEWQRVPILLITHGLAFRILLRAKAVAPSPSKVRTA